MDDACGSQSVADVKGLAEHGVEGEEIAGRGVGEVEAVGGDRETGLGVVEENADECGEGDDEVGDAVFGAGVAGGDGGEVAFGGGEGTIGSKRRSSGGGEAKGTPATRRPDGT